MLDSGALAPAQTTEWELVTTAAVAGAPENGGWLIAAVVSLLVVLALTAVVFAAYAVRRR